MLPPVAALHHAARGYLIDQLAAYDAARPSPWADPPEPMPEGLVEQGRAAFIQEAILREIERTLPTDFATLEELRAFLNQVAATAQPPRGPLERPPERNAAGRAQFQTFLDGLSTADLAQVRPAPFRHVLGVSGRQKVMSQLRERWDIRWGVWPEDWQLHPFAQPGPPETLPPDLLSLRQADFHRRYGAERLIRLLQQRRGIPRVYEVTESHQAPVYEMDFRPCTFLSVPDCCWTSKSGDWVVYQSHERCMVFAGGWLVEALKADWPEWQHSVDHGYGNGSL
jgi:hypothetical protein